MFRPRQAQDHLGNYWNALNRGVSGHELARLADLVDPTDIAAIDRAHALHERRRPDPAFAIRLENMLMDAYSATTAGSIPLPPVPSPSANGRFEPPAAGPWQRRLPSLPAMTSRPRLAWAQLVTALLLIVTIGGTFLVFNNTLFVPDTSQPEPAESPGWTHFKGDSARRGETNAGPVEQPVELWRYQANGPCLPAPAVAGDIVYVACDDSTLYAFDAATGELRWQFTAEPFAAGPSVAGDLAYVVGGSGTLYAVDTATGQERWRFDAFPVSASPAVETGVLVVAADGGTLAGIDAETGAQRWRYQVTDGGATRAPALLDGVAYVGSETGDFTAIDVETGTLKWTVDTGENPTGTAVVADGIAYIGSAAEDQTGSLAAYGAETGELLWRRDDPMHSPSVSNGVGYSGSADGTVYAFNTADGTELWRIQVGGVARPLAIAGDILYVPSDGDRAIYAIDAATGDILWNVAVDGGINDQMAVVDGRMYVPTTSGVIQAFGEGEPGIAPGPQAASPAASPIATPEMSTASTPAAPGTPGADTMEPAALLWTVEGREGGMSFPGNMAFDPQGRLWVVDNGNDRFQIFDQDGTFLEAWGEPGSGDGQFQFNRSNGDGYGGIAFTPDGSFYVLDPGSHRVQKFDANRAFVTNWGGIGREPGQFMGPIGIAVAPDGTVWVADDVGDRIHHFDADGNALGGFDPRPESDPGSMWSNGLAIDREGNLYVSDAAGYQVRVFAPDGTEIQTLGERGDGMGQFIDQPIGIAFMANGDVIVAEGTFNPTGKGRIHRFGNNGDAIEHWDTQSTLPYGIAVASDGSVYTTDYLANTVEKYQLNVPVVGEATAEPSGVAESQGAEFLWQSTGDPDPLLAPLSTTFDPNGNLWVTDAANNRFQIFSPDGEYLETWGIAGDAEGEFNFNHAPGDPLGSWGDIAFGPDGTFYVADSANRRVQKFDANRNFVRAWGTFGTGDGQFSDPIGIAVAPDGNVYVIDDRRDDIQVFDPDGTHLFTFGGHGTGPGQLNFTGSLAIDSGGSVYVADFSNHRIQKFAADGTFVAMFGEFGTGEGQFNGPGDVAVDQAGYLYVTEAEGGRVQVFDQDGEYMASWSHTDADGNEFMNPIGIVVDSQGGVYVADTGAGTVQKFQVSLPPVPEATPGT
jgi:outer membrane protein assembly factor BamB